LYISSESSSELEFDNVPETSPKSDTSPEQFNPTCDDTELAIVATSAQQSDYEADVQFDFDKMEFFEFQMPQPFIFDLDFGPLIHRLPSSVRSAGFYFDHHRERINGCYYYSYYDYQQLFTKGLLTLADESNAVYYGLIAFSALIYSLRIDPTARHAAYCFYSLAVKELRSLLDKPMDVKLQRSAQCNCRLFMYISFEAGFLMVAICA